MHLFIFYVEVFFSLSLTLLTDLTRISRLTWRMPYKKRKLHTFHPVDLLRSVYLIFSVFLLVLCVFLLFVFVQCFVCFVLSGSVYCPFVIAFNVYSTKWIFYIMYWSMIGLTFPFDWLVYIFILIILHIFMMRYND